MYEGALAASPDDVGRSYGAAVDEEPTILFGWNAVSGDCSGWFPAVVKRPCVDAYDESLNFEIFSGPRSSMGPAFSERSVGCINGRVDVALKPEEYGTKWVVLEDLRPKPSDAFLEDLFHPDGSVPDALLDDATFADVLVKCGGHDPDFVLNLGFVLRGGDQNDGVGLDTGRWARLTALLLAYLAKHAPQPDIYMKFAELLPLKLPDKMVILIDSKPSHKPGPGPGFTP